MKKLCVDKLSNPNQHTNRYTSRHMYKKDNLMFNDISWMQILTANYRTQGAFFVKALRFLSFSNHFSLVWHWTRRTVICCFETACGLTLHWHRVHSVPCLIQEEPLKREMLCSSVHVLVMSLRMVSAWQGSVTQRGQHSPSGTTVNSQSTGGHGSGQQSTCPCCRNTHRERICNGQTYS